MLIRRAWCVTLAAFAAALLFTLGDLGPAPSFTAWTALALPLFLVTWCQMARTLRPVRPPQSLAWLGVWLLLLLLSLDRVSESVSKVLPMMAVLFIVLAFSVFPFALTFFALSRLPEPGLSDSPHPGAEDEPGVGSKPSKAARRCRG